MNDVEQRVADVKDLRDGQRKLVKVGHTNVLPARIKGQFCAIGGTGPHGGGRLSAMGAQPDQIASCMERTRTGRLLSVERIREDPMAELVDTNTSDKNDRSS
jgi:nitrite reductase/ring-hydroxylating ferredoxin subunit